MINREDLLELTRRMTRSRNCFDRIADSYMDGDGYCDGSFNICQRFPSDSNRQPADYETAALPLRQRSMIGAAGIEPATFCLTGRRSTD